MNNFIFENATKIYFGQGCVKEYLGCLLKDSHTVMLAYGGGSIQRNGIYDEVTGILTAAGKTVVEFSGIMSNPTYAKVRELSLIHIQMCIRDRDNIQRGCRNLYRLCEENGLESSSLTWDMNEKGIWKEKRKGVDDYLYDLKQKEESEKQRKVGTGLL